jgi:hypothetical protein
VLFAVVVCSHCRRAQVVDGGSRHVHCRACARSFDVLSRKKFYVGEDAQTARQMASKVSLQLNGAPIEAIADTVEALEREQTMSLRQVVDELQKRPEFILADVEDQLLRAMLTTTAARVVEGLRLANRLYEPRPGRFRWVA